jgi:alanine-glyoxylate transaminase/serine-glyoxylate transaminase/serine-pyruvate transaminase
MIASNATGFFPYTPATNMLYALDTALDMLFEEGLENVFARHDRHGRGHPPRRARLGPGDAVPGPAPLLPRADGGAVPEGHSANALRATILERFNMSLGNGLGRLNDKVFRIGHLGDVGDLHMVGTLTGVEMGLRAAGVPAQAGRRAGGDGLAGNAWRAERLTP